MYFCCRLGRLEGIIAFNDEGNVSKAKIVSALLTACKVNFSAFVLRFIIVYLHNCFCDNLGFVCALCGKYLLFIKEYVPFKHCTWNTVLKNGALLFFQKLHKAEDELVKLGYKREAILIYKEHACVLTHMARDAATPSEKHNLYLQVRVFSP